MARIEFIEYAPTWIDIENNNVIRNSSQRGPNGLVIPQIFWRSNMPWREANAWLLTLALDNTKDEGTVKDKAYGILTCAKFLESEQIAWDEFPSRTDRRSLNRLRGSLILKREENYFAPSTSSSRMSAAILFYSWAAENRLLNTPRDSTEGTNIVVHYQDRQGRTRRKNVVTNRLHIKCKTTAAAVPEGVWPVSIEDQEKILDFADAWAPIEIALMLTIGFYTGLRIGTITSLKVQTIHQALKHPMSENMSVIAVGPGASPAVATKFGITGHIDIPTTLIDYLKSYCTSARRIARTQKSAPENRNLLFLTKFGNPYARGSKGSSNPINTAMSELRRVARELKFSQLYDFNFHRTRATFATDFARICVAMDSFNAIGNIKRQLLQKDERSAWRYIHFIEKAEIANASANRFTREFRGTFDDD